MTDLSTMLRDAPRNRWIALSHDENTIVGDGKNIEQAVQKAKENGEDNPVLIWAPKAWVAAVYMLPHA